MKRHINYLKYVLRHKWFVFIAGLAIGVSWWRLIKHDWHKFLPGEWMPYASTFYAPDGKSQYVESGEFSYAWNLHQKRADHHWQHWLITWDRGQTECLPMSDAALKEMLADWYGAGRAITGQWGAREWYQKNADKIQIHPVTRARVEKYLETIETLNLLRKR